MHFIGRLADEARRVAEDNLEVIPAEDTNQPVAGGLWFIRDNTHAFAHQRVHEGRFTDIGSADDIDEA